jgi:hypothetical protein
MLILIGVAIFNRLKSLNENPVQQFKDPDQHVTILVAPDGLFGTQVRQIGNPRRGPIDITPEPLALPAPLRELSPIPIGHVLIAGGSGSGKSTAMRAIIEKRRGEVLVIDPHAAPNEWNASRVIGMEGNFDAIAEFFGWMQNELARRTGLRGRGEQMDFPELTVATDELPAIVTKLGKREATAAWIDWIEQGRKFGLFAMLSSQSTSVRSMGIDGKGDLRKQFSAVVSLGSEAERRFPEIAQGMTRPAVVELEGRQARPVIIPNVPAFASAGANGYANGSAVVVDQPIINQKPDPDRPAGMSTEKGFIPEDEVKRILHYGRTLPSLRQVATAVYNQTGGVGFYKTKAVLNRYGVTPGQA